MIDQIAHQIAARVNITSGISAKGMPNESTTWLITSVRVGSSPMRDHDQRRQHRDQPRRTQIGIVPVQKALHDHLPGHRADRRRRQPGGQQRNREDRCSRAAEQRLQRPVRFLDRRRSSVSPCAWKVEAAMISIAALTQPGHPHGDHDIDDLEAEQRASAAPVVAATMRFCVSAECR